MNILLTYGIRDGELVGIDDVVSGLACHCQCPACGTDLVAKTKAQFKRAHFAHYNKIECEYQYETELHYRAKAILQETNKIIIPKFFVNEHNRLATKEFEFHYDSVVLEKKLGTIVPDIILSKGDRQLIIEIAVTHFVDEIKSAKIKQLKIPVIEIDLSGLKSDFIETELADILINGIDFKTWIYNEKKLELLEKIRLEHARKRKRIEEEVFRENMEKERREKYYLEHLLDITIRESKEARSSKVHHVSCPISKRLFNGFGYANVHRDCFNCTFFRGFRSNKSKIICLKSQKLP